MLIQKKNLVEVNDIVTIKLISGEEIIGRLVATDADSIFLAKPLHIILEPVSSNQVGLSILPVLGSVSEMGSVQFPYSGMTIRPLRTSDQVRSNYVEITTGLVTPAERFQP